MKMKYVKQMGEILNFISYKISLIAIFTTILACVDIDNEENNTQQLGQDQNDFDLSVLFKHFDESVNIYIEGNNIVIQADGVPGHKSPYFPKTVDLSNGGYYYWIDQNSDGINDMWSEGNNSFRQNPNFIAEQNYTFRIPIKPAKAKSPTQTSLGPIGVSINGVPFYNQYEGPNTATDLIVPGQGVARSLDGSTGHPAQQGRYHYHMIPDSLLLSTEDNFLGFAADGFPIYGPKNPDSLNVSGLDDCNGEYGPTPDFPDSIYHYHTISVAPYIIGAYCGDLSNWRQ